MADTQTQVSIENLSLDQILGTPGAGSVLLPEDKNKKPGMFSREIPAAASFIETPGRGTEDEEEDTQDAVDSADQDDTGATGDIIDQPGAMAETPEQKAARDKDLAKVNKGAMIQGIQSLIEKGIMQPFDDEKAIKDYTIADVTELIEANLSAREKKVRDEYPVEFFESLPNELQYAVEYLSKGGNDYKSLFRALAGVEEVRQLDPKNPANHEAIVRNYLRASNFGTEEDITEEIDGWRDRGELEAKATKFKPKLDKMQEEQVNAQLANQDAIQRQRASAARAYGDSIFKILEPAELNGIKLDKKTQTMLYAGLVQPNYPSITGQPTNLLGHLLEKYQYTKEANHPLIAEALYLLADPDGYRAKVQELGKKKATEKTVRELKTEQASGKSGSGAEDEDEGKAGKSKGLPRMQNFFQRTNK